jgi:hypothetical protein
MKRMLVIATLICSACTAYAQEGGGLNENIEIASETEDVEKDDSYIQQREYLIRHPLSINEATVSEWEDSGLLTDWQLASFIEYRRLLGPFVSLYELQAIPGWDVETIRKLLPFVILRNAENLLSGNFGSWQDGEQLALIRWGRKTGGDNYWEGSPFSLQARYKYKYRNLWQFGMLADKDAGEPLLTKWNQKGFDFYSFHFFARKQGVIESIALGDFTVNMGQGLLQWQQLAFKKGAGLSGVKRQGAVLRPYSSAGEYNFHRGAGITIQKTQWHVTAFASVRLLDGNVRKDSLNSYMPVVSSVLKSGLHRTWGELADRGQVLVTTFGGNIQYKAPRFKAGINSVTYTFSLPIQKIAEPYNLYAIKGSRWANYSFDFSYTVRNFHFFGEIAIDRKKNPAIVQGVYISMDSKLDMAFLYRRLDKGYQSLFSNAFTEKSDPGNESGFYWGLTFRPRARWQIDGYMDIYKFHWLQYQIDKPGLGIDYLLQVMYSPSRSANLVLRYRDEAKSGNMRLDINRGEVAVIVRKQIRFQLDYSINKVWRFRTRFDLNWIPWNGSSEVQRGFSAFSDVFYNPQRSYIDLSLRLHVFETDSYDSRVYAFENDLLYSNSIPAFSGHGFRWYLLSRLDLSKIKYIKFKNNISFFLKIAQTVEQNQVNGVFSGGFSNVLITNDLKFQILFRI